jgi:hypothetical protein
MDAKRLTSPTPHDRELVLDAPWMAYTEPLSTIADSMDSDFSVWHSADPQNPNLIRCEVRDVSGENGFFSYVKLMIDKSEGYRILEWEADFPNESDKYMKTRRLTYDSDGSIRSVTMQFVDSQSGKVLMSSVTNVSDIKSSVDEDEFSPEFYGLMVPGSRGHVWTLRRYAAASFVAFLVVFAVIMIRRRSKS